MNQLPDPITFLEGLLPGNPFQGEPPLPRILLRLMAQQEEQAAPSNGHQEPEIPELEKIRRPGCTAAEGAGAALFHLEGLAYEGRRNFGVLAVSRKRLEEGAAAAASLGREDLASQMRRIADDLPAVHDAEHARRLAQELRPLTYNNLWDLGANCKGDFSPEQMAQARILAQQVHAGEISLEEAIRRVRAAHNP